MNNTPKNGGALCVAVFVSLLSSIALSSCGQSPPRTDSQGRVHGTIVSVTDGDTIEVRLASSTERVRLIGVDTPETKHPTKPIECFGPEASAHTHSLLPNGTDVIVVRDEEARDKYGRLLAYVFRSSDNLFVNLDLVSGGWAHTLSIPPNTAYEDAFSIAVATAERMRLGLWAQCPR